MNILVDLRSLQSGNFSGVENYTIQLVLELLKTDKKNFYILFFSGLNKINFSDFDFINARVIHTQLPNRLLNILFKFRFISIERLVGEFDVLFMPNLNVIHMAENKPLLISFHDLSFVRFPEFYDLKRRLWHWFLNPKKLLTTAGKIVAVSNYTKNDMVEKFGIPNAKIEVIYPGVDTQYLQDNTKPDRLIETRNHLGLPKKFFLFLNTIEPRKNLINIILAFEQFSGEEYLVIAGKLGWKTASTLNKIKNSSKKSKIIYLGYVNEFYKPALIKLSTALLYPSFYEGFGFQVLEANALNIPAVISQVTSLPEIADSSNLFVNPYNVRDILLAMQVLSKQSVESTKLNYQLETKFSWQKNAEQMLNILEAICV
jgi:glycosyltransferase involved in cell wall biosynthesis